MHNLTVSPKVCSVIDNVYGVQKSTGAQGTFTQGTMWVIQDGQVVRPPDQTNNKQTWVHCLLSKTPTKLSIRLVFV